MLHRIGIIYSMCFMVQAGEQIGWTGFTWDNHLFPNPKGFLDWWG